MINCIIIEDEPLAQRGLLSLIRAFDDIKVLQVCDDISEFLKFRETDKELIDLLFLDIELPGLKGIDFLRDTQLDIPVVLTTAYDKYAMEGYELNVLDYLLKPISPQRFAQTIKKAESYLHFLHPKSGDPHDSTYIKSDKVLERVFFNEIVVVEAMRNYVIYHCEKRKLICYNSLKNVEQTLPPEQFVKVQKSFVINRNKIDKIEKGNVFIHNMSISLNRENRNDIIKRLTAV